MKILKKIIYIFAICAIFCAVVYYGILFALVNFVDLNKYKNSISESVENSTGFKISCEDISFKKSLAPYLKIHLFHTLLLYPDDEVFLKLKEVDLQVKIIPLIFKNIVIKDVELTRPIVNITLYKDFSTSLEKYIDTSKVINTHGFKLTTVINDAVLKDYKIKFKDESINKTFYLEGSNLILRYFKPENKAQIILKGSLFESKNEYLNYDIDIMSVLNTSEKHFTFSPFKTILESNAKGSLTGNLKIDKENNISGNLKIKDLSLKLDDVNSTNNSANFVFKGKEVEINSVIHTSDTDSANITGKFNFGKNKYIDLNTNAQNIKIENLLKIISEISQMINLKNPLNDIKIKGLLDADFNINSDFKKLKSSGKAQIIDASFVHNCLPYKLSDINAFVNFNNNNVTIEKADAKINETPISIKGNIKEDVSFNIDAFSQNLNIVNLINIFDSKKKLPFSFSRGNLSLDVNISGILNKFYKINSKVKLTDLNFTDTKYNIPIAVKSADINFLGDDKKYNGQIQCSDFSLKHSGQNITANEFNLNFDENKITIPPNSISSPVKLELSGVVNEYKNNPFGNINFKGEVPSSFIAQRIKQKINLPHKAVGFIKTVGNIDYTSEKMNINAKLKADEKNYLSYSVIKELINKPSVLNIDCDITKDALNIKEISLNEYTSNEKNIPLIQAKGQILKGEYPDFKNFKITIPQAITIAANYFGGEEISFNADLLLNKQINNPEIKGNAKILKYNIKKYFTQIKDADISFNDDNIRIIAPDTVVKDSSFNIIADLVPSFDLKNTVVSNLQINSINLDLNSFYSMTQKEDEFNTIPNFTVEKGTVTVNNLKVLDLKSKDISSDIQIEKNIIRLSNIEASAYAGNITGKINYDLTNSSLDINMSGKGLDIKTSLYDLCKIKDDLEGKYNFTTQISLIIGKYNDVIKSLTGSLKFNAYEGKMGTLGKFEYYLYAQNLLYHGFLNATLNRIADAIVRDDTAKYKQAGGTFIFQNGYMLTDGVETTGINMSLYMKGKHNLLTNMANIDIYGRISDEVKSKLGNFGNTSISEIIKGQEDKRNIKPVTLPSDITNKIPYLYNQQETKSNMFKVNICGNINSLNSINSFEWIVPNKEEREKLPEFSDMLIKDDL